MRPEVTLVPVAVRQTEALLREVPAIRRELGLSQEALARALGVASRTVARWEAGHTTPSPLAAHRLRLMAEILERARRLFGRQEAEAWLRTPNPALGGQPPLQRVGAPGGIEEVRDLLGRIEWGIPT